MKYIQRFFYGYLENEEKPRAVRLKKQSEDFVNCIKRSEGGAALTNDDTGVISLQYEGQPRINNNVDECIDNYKKMNSKFEEILNLANSLTFTSFPIADDVLDLQNSLKNQTTSLTEFKDSFNEYCNGVRDMEENICSVFSKISGITVGISEFRGVSAISKSGQVDKNKVIQLMLKNPNDLTNGEKELLSYVEKVLSKDEYAELKEQAIKGNNGQGIADNLKLKFGDTRYGPLLELANNDGFLKSIKKAGEDFIIGAGNSLDKNIFLGTVFTVDGINQSSMPKSIPYKIGELAGDIGSFAFGAAEAGIGAGGELLGFTAVLAPAGVALNAASLGLVTHGGTATIKSAHNFSEDLFSLIKGEGNKGAAEAEKAISRIDEVEVNFNYKTKYDEAEFARQLADQEAGMNKLTVDEYLKNRERYIAEGRAIEGNMAQQAARKEALANKIDELLDSGMSYQEAERHANKWLESQAALHNPDQVAGGNSSNIGGMGDKTINSSIGVQWKYRIDAVDEQIQQMAKNMTDIEKESTYLNVKLKY